MIIKKYDILKINLNPKKGHTQSGVRPCVVIQSNIFNEYSSTILIIPLTSVVKNIFPSEFWIHPSENNGLEKKSRFLGSQIIIIDKEYILEKIGFIEEKYHEEVKEAISISLDLNNQY